MDAASPHDLLPLRLKSTFDDLPLSPAVAAVNTLLQQFEDGRPLAPDSPGYHANSRGRERDDGDDDGGRSDEDNYYDDNGDGFGSAFVMPPPGVVVGGLEDLMAEADRALESARKWRGHRFASAADGGGIQCVLCVW